MFDVDVGRRTLVAALAAGPATIAGAASARSRESVARPRSAAIDVVRRNTEIVQGQGDWTLFDRIFDDDFQDHTPQPGLGSDKRAVLSLYKGMRRAFPDFHAVIHWQADDHGLVTTFKTYHGTHRGTFLGLQPTNRPVEFITVDAMRVRQGRITDHWGVADLYGAVRRLGGLGDAAI